MHVLIVDDHQLFRTGLQALLLALDPDVQVRQAESTDGAIALARVHTFDLVLLDLNLVGSEGIESLEALKPVFPSCPLVVMSGDESPTLIRQALNMGASGYIPKSTDTAITLLALRLVLAHGVYLPPVALHCAMAEESSQDILHASDSSELVAAQADGHLSERQLAVLHALLLGKANKVIARDLALSESSVKAHLWAIYQFLGVKTRAQAMGRAHEQGLLPQLPFQAMPHATAPTKVELAQRGH